MKTLSMLLLTSLAAAAISAAAQGQSNRPVSGSANDPVVQQPIPVGTLDAQPAPPGSPPEEVLAQAPAPPDQPAPGAPPGQAPPSDQSPAGQPGNDQPDDSSPPEGPASAASQTATNNAPAEASAPITASPTWSTNGASSGSLSNLVRMNFDKAPLRAVLNYLSDMYGFVITGDTDVRGQISIIANDPINYKDAVDLLNAALTKNGYQAVQSGNTLTILTLSDAKKAAGTPVITGANPEKIPNNDTVVTQIIPVQSLNPTQLARDLQSLFPERDTMTPNEGGNALIMTAPQSDIRRIAEIIHALDSSSVSDVKVFRLQYADSKSVASELKDIFTDPNAQQNNIRNFIRMRFAGGGGGPFGGGGFPGGGGGGDSGSSSNPIRVNAVSDDQNNAVLVSASTEVMGTVSNLINDLDQPSQDVTAVRVFHLKHADPTETADELASLFPDETSSSTSDRSMGYQFFGGRGGGFGRGGGGGNTQPSARMKLKSKVIAVADRRTSAVIVTASRDLMTQIASMVADLDQTDAHQEVVVSIPIGYADPSEVQTLMQDLFQGTTARPSSSSTTTSALQQRQTQNAQQQNSSSTTGFGSGGSGMGTSGLR